MMVAADRLHRTRCLNPTKPLIKSDHRSEIGPNVKRARVADLSGVKWLVMLLLLIITAYAVGSTMEATVEGLVDELQRKLASGPYDRRLLIGLCGIPGSGKSQLASHVVQMLNKQNARRGALNDVAIVVGMDGWHLSRAQLERMPDPQLAKDRRGAAWTFDDAVSGASFGGNAIATMPEAANMASYHAGYQSFARFVEKLHSAPIKETVYAPSFSHAKKDPVPDDIQVRPEHRIVLIEGLYANVNEGAWAEASRLYDERWLIECDEKVARQRLVQRHVRTGVAQSIHEAEWRGESLLR